VYSKQFFYGVYINVTYKKGRKIMNIGSGLPYITTSTDTITKNFLKMQDGSYVNVNRISRINANGEVEGYVIKDSKASNASYEAKETFGKLFNATA